MRLIYANVVATLALVVAVGCGGTALAGGHLPKNSVTSKSVKNGSLQGKDVKDGSITAADLAPGTVPTTPAPLVVTGQRVGVGTVPAYSPDPAATQIATVTITAPAAGFIEVNGFSYFKSSPRPDYAYAQLFEVGAGTSIGSTNWSTYAGDTVNFALNQTVVGVAPVTAGTHTYSLNVFESTKDGSRSSYGGAQVIATYFPGGSVAAP